jgi:hypothetical protein
MYTSDPVSSRPETCSQLKNASGFVKVGSGTLKKAGCPATSSM